MKCQQCWLVDYWRSWESVGLYEMATINNPTITIKIFTITYNAWNLVESSPLFFPDTGKNPDIGHRIHTSYWCQRQVPGQKLSGFKTV